jgi:hypothetical protein
MLSGGGRRGADRACDDGDVVPRVTGRKARAGRGALRRVLAHRPPLSLRHRRLGTSRAPRPGARGAAVEARGVRGKVLPLDAPEGARVLHRLPTAESVPVGRDACRAGPRLHAWRNDAPATVWWVEAQVRAVDSPPRARKVPRLQSAPCAQPCAPCPSTRAPCPSTRAPCPSTRAPRPERRGGDT